MTVKALKFIFIDIWVALGEWLWKQLTDFWDWCYDKFIGPYLVEPLMNAWNFLKELWTETIYPKIKPFVESAKVLIDKLKNLGGAIKQAILDWWNGDSSLGDTLKNIGTTVWNVIKEWWSTSVFKEYWDKAKVYLDDLLQPLKDWWNESWLGKTFQMAWT